MDIRIALAGNPNSGKTTLFNALTGSNQFVGNWPGVTVEKKEGKLKGKEGVIITDLPGVYSLSPYTLEEVVARNYLVNERPNAILNIVDGTNLERNLYLTTQLIELGIPVVVAINMMDVVNKNGDTIDLEILSRGIGCKVVDISALKGDGIERAAELAIEAAKENKKVPLHSYSGAVEHALAHIEEAAVHHLPAERQRWYAVKIFERDSMVLKELGLSIEKLMHIDDDIKAAEAELDDESDSIIINERYTYIEQLIKKCYKRKNEGKLTVSDKIDRVVTNRVLALPIFALIMFLVYYVSVTTLGAWLGEWITDGVFGEGFDIFGKHVDGIPVLIENLAHCEGGWLLIKPWLYSLIQDGIIKGVGSVLGFVPQMFILFIFLAFLEGCGYMSRIAFVMDRIFRKFGLSGKSFIPLLIGTGCSVPGIMSSRTIENESDRRMTVITTSFIPCSAKLPVVALIASAFFGNSWWIAPSAYFLGILAVVISGIILKKSKLFSGDVAPFVLELPAYHMPTLNSVWRATWERGWSFVKRAGTVILLSSVIIWAFDSFGRDANGVWRFFRQMPEDATSLLTMVGGVFAKLFVPLGFGSSTAAIATLMGLVAKEEIVAVFGVLDFGSMDALSGYSFLTFNLLCAPCFAAMGAIRREMNSAKWTVFAIGYQCVFAYAVSLMIYQFGSALRGDVSVIGLIFAMLILAVSVYFILRKPRNTAK